MSKQKTLEVVERIQRMMEKPGSKPLTSSELKVREDYRNQLANQLKREGRGVNKDYE